MDAALPEARLLGKEINTTPLIWNELAMGKFP